MKDNFVPYKIAVRLKELRFDEPCMAASIFRPDGEEVFKILLTPSKPNYNKWDLYYPLLQQVKKWFLKKHGVHTTIDWEFYDGFHYFFKYTFPNGTYGQSDEYYDTMDEAEIQLIEKIIGMLAVNK